MIYDGGQYLELASEERAGPPAQRLTLGPGPAGRSETITYCLIRTSLPVCSEGRAAAEDRVRSGGKSLLSGCNC